MSSQVLVFAGSARKDSVNKKLAKLAARDIEAVGGIAVLVDLAEFPMPVYNGDMEASEGIPTETKAFFELVDQADGIVIASPEYNGSFSALLKNTIDWVSRVDGSAFAKPTLLMSATPGGKGGRNGLEILRSSLSNMAVPVVEEQVSVAKAGEALVGGELVNDEDKATLRSGVAALLEATASEKAA